MALKIRNNKYVIYKDETSLTNSLLKCLLYHLCHLDPLRKRCPDGIRCAIYFLGGTHVEEVGVNKEYLKTTTGL